jgi:putative membrane protein
LEVLPAVIGFVILAVTYFRFKFTRLVYFFIALHMVVLMVGGHYTYAQVPLFDWLKDLFHLERNHYDRLAHFTQGFVPALITREILLKTSPLRRGKLLFFIVACICLAVSAFYEFIEWWVAAATGAAAEAFLGTQGDVWDTQWDMFLALCGAMASQLLLSRSHDAHLERQLYL